MKKVATRSMASVYSTDSIHLDGATASVPDQTLSTLDESQGNCEQSVLSSVCKRHLGGRLQRVDRWARIRNATSNFCLMSHTESKIYEYESGDNAPTSEGSDSEDFNYLIVSVLQERDCYIEGFKFEQNYFSGTMNMFVHIREQFPCPHCWNKFLMDWVVDYTNRLSIIEMIDDKVMKKFLRYLHDANGTYFDWKDKPRAYRFDNQRTHFEDLYRNFEINCDDYLFPTFLKMNRWQKLQNRQEVEFVPLEVKKPQTDTLKVNFHLTRLQREKIPKFIQFKLQTELSVYQLEKLGVICREVGVNKPFDLLVLTSHVLIDLYERQYFNTRIKESQIRYAIASFVNTKCGYPRFDREGMCRLPQKDCSVKKVWRKRIVYHLPFILTTFCENEPLHKHKFYSMLKIAVNYKDVRPSFKYQKRVRRNPKTFPDDEFEAQGGFGEPSEAEYKEEVELVPDCPQCTRMAIHYRNVRNVRRRFQFVNDLLERADFYGRMVYDSNALAARNLYLRMAQDATGLDPSVFEAQMMNGRQRQQMGVFPFQDEIGAAVANAASYITDPLMQNAQTRFNDAAVVAAQHALRQDAVQDSIADALTGAIDKLFRKSVDSCKGFLSEPIKWMMDFFKTIMDKVGEFVWSAYGWILSPIGLKFLKILFGMIILWSALMLIKATVDTIKLVTKTFSVFCDLGTNLSDELYSVYRDTQTFEAQSIWSVPVSGLLSLISIAFALTGSKNLATLNAVSAIVVRYDSFESALTSGWKDLFNWVWLCFNDQPFYSNEELEGLMSIIGKVQKFLGPESGDIDSDIMNNRDKASELINLHDEMMKYQDFIYKTRSISPALSNSFSKLLLRVTEMHNLVNLSSVMAKERMAAVSLWLHGKSGGGKTTIIDMIEKSVWSLLQMKYGKNEYPDFNAETSFPRVMGSPYWERYHGNKMVKIGEAMQQTSEDLTVEFCMEFLHMCESARFVLNMAFDQKGKAVFAGEFVSVTSNLPLTLSDLKKVGIRFPEALVRRMTFPLEVVRNFDMKLDPSLDNVDEAWKFVLDGSKIEDYFREAYLLGVSEFLPGAREAIRDKKKVHYDYTTVIAAIFEEIVSRKETKPFDSHVSEINWVERVAAKLDVAKYFPEEHGKYDDIKCVHCEQGMKSTEVIDSMTGGTVRAHPECMQKYMNQSLFIPSDVYFWYQKRYFDPLELTMKCRICEKSVSPIYHSGRQWLFHRPCFSTWCKGDDLKQLRPEILKQIREIDDLIEQDDARYIFEAQGKRKRTAVEKEMHKFNILEQFFAEYFNSDFRYKRRDKFIKRVILDRDPDWKLPPFFLQVYRMLISNRGFLYPDSLTADQVVTLLADGIEYCHLYGDNLMNIGLSLVNEFCWFTNHQPCYEPRSYNKGFRSYNLANGYQIKHLVLCGSQYYRSYKEVFSCYAGHVLVDWDLGDGTQSTEGSKIESFVDLFAEFVHSLADVVAPFYNWCMKWLVDIGLCEEKNRARIEIKDGTIYGPVLELNKSFEVISLVLLALGTTASVAGSIVSLVRLSRKENSTEETVRLLIEDLMEEEEQVEIVAQAGVGMSEWVPCTQFDKGDVIGVSRNIRGVFHYIHVGVVVDNLDMPNCIVHFSGEPGSKRGASVKYDSLQNFLFKDDQSKLLKLKVKKVVLPVDVVVSNAISRIGVAHYHALKNNCEHFAFECKFGEAYSPQAQNLVNRFTTFQAQSFDQKARMKRAGDCFTAHSIQHNARMKREECFTAHSAELNARQKRRQVFTAHGAKTEAVKKEAEVFVAQSLNNCYNRINDVSRNTSIFRFVGKFDHEIPGVFIHERTALIPMHIVSSSPDVRLIEICNKVGEVQFPFRRDQVDIRPLEGRDLALITFPNTMPSRVSIKKAIPSKSSYRDIHKKFGVVRVETATDDTRHATVVVTSSKMLAGTRPKASKLTTETGENIYTVVEEYLEVEDCPGKIGVCGTGYILTDANVAEWFAGIHVGGTGDTSIVCPIWREDLESECFEAQMYIPVIPEFLNSRMDSSAVPIGHVPRGTTFLGTVSIPSSSGLQDSHFPSVFQRGAADMPPIFEVKTMPARLRRFRDSTWNLIDPSEMAADKMWGLPKSPVPRFIEQIVDTQPHLLWDDLCPFPNHQLRRLTIRESLFGNPDKGISSFDNDTSPGYMGKLLGKNRKQWFDLQTQWIHAEFEKLVMEIVRLKESGHIYLNVTEFCLKAELRDIARVIAGKTRGFHIGDLALAVATKMIVGDAVQHLKTTRQRGTGAIGTNVHGVDWKNIYNKLQFDEDVVWLETDAEGYDTHVQPWAGTLLGKFMNHLYGYSPKSKEYTAVMCVCKAAVGCIMIYGRNVIKLDWMNPSGSWMTGTINTCLNHFMCNAMFIIVKKKCLSEGCGCLDGWNQKRVMQRVYYGDDSLITLLRRFAHHFNQFEFESFYREHFGMVLTNSDKSKIDRPYKTKEEVRFLSRAFRKVGPFVYGPLEKDTIESVLLWVSNTFKTPAEQNLQLSEQTRIAMEEAFYHGQEYYEELEDKVTRYCSRFGVEYKGQNYQYWSNNHAAQYLS